MAWHRELEDGGLEDELPDPGFPRVVADGTREVTLGASVDFSLCRSHDTKPQIKATPTNISYLKSQSHSSTPGCGGVAAVLWTDILGEGKLLFGLGKLCWAVRWCENCSVCKS